MSKTHLAIRTDCKGVESLHLPLPPKEAALVPDKSLKWDFCITPQSQPKAACFMRADWQM